MLILASQAPRRVALLQRITKDFQAQGALIDERALPLLPPADYVQSLAQAKGRAVAELHPKATVIAADTMVAFHDQLLGKPRDEADALGMLQALSGQVHHVHTGVYVRQPDGQEQLQAVTTAVEFWPLSDAEIQLYLSCGEYRDKAGAYGIQGQGALLVKGIVGDYYNVMGLPISTLARML
ncbi:Maf family protein [Lacticaseibacillus sp. N501-2]|uniref:Maf family protein n=1 Tax=Lacticaseibacillus salsurae TaxID=3367729 RepID=UPI0038B39851